MIAAVVNALLVLLGSLVGIVFKNKIKEKYTKTINAGMAMCILVIGMSSAIKTANAIHLIICLVVGIILGEALKIEDRLDTLGEFLKRKFVKNDGSSSRFTEGFVASTLLFCIGSMAIMGSLEAGINHDYTIIFSKSIIDCVTAVTFAAAMGIGVAFSGAAVLIYQGGLTLLASYVAPFLSDAVVTEMSAVGGCVLLCIGFNMVGFGKEKMKAGHMLPAIFLPIVYIPLYNWLMGLL